MVVDDIKCLRVETNKYLVPWELATAPASITRALNFIALCEDQLELHELLCAATITLNCNNLPMHSKTFYFL